MLFDIEKDLTLCEKYKITPEQLTFIKIFIFDQTVSDIKSFLSTNYKNGIRFWKLLGVDITKSGFKDTQARIDYNKLKTDVFNRIAVPLMKKKILVETKLSPNADLDIIEINPNFVQDFELDIYDKPTQLFNCYPQFVGDVGNKFIGRTASPEEIGLTYIKNINNNTELHNEILELIKWAHETNQLRIGLKKFVQYKHWEALREIKKGGINIGFDTNIV